MYIILTEKQTKSNVEFYLYNFLNLLNQNGNRTNNRINGNAGVDLIIECINTGLDAIIKLMVKRD